MSKHPGSHKPRPISKGGKKRPKKKGVIKK